VQRIIIIGGGIAGLGTAWCLARRGRSVLLLEQAPSFAAASSARSAGMFRLAVADPLNVELAVRSRQLGEELAPGAFRRTGGLYVCAGDAERRAILSASASAGVREATEQDLPEWLTDRARPAVQSPCDGILDVPALVEALTRQARALGADLRSGAGVTGIDTRDGRVTGVMTASERFPADVVIDCAGSWSVELAGAPSLSHALHPRRRHLFVLEGDARLVPGIVWDLGAGVYVRPHEEGILASACDESAISPTLDVPVDSTVVDSLRTKLSRWAPALARCPVRRSWAGVRPLTKDHRFLVGPDRSLAGLFRVTGFGGHGVSAGLAAAEVAAAILCDEPTPLAAALDPHRA
jgi:glycine/D-amino acid oxidase-like deaminating enzyme